MALDLSDHAVPSAPRILTPKMHGIHMFLTHPCAICMHPYHRKKSHNKIACGDDDTTQAATAAAPKVEALQNAVKQEQGKGEAAAQATANV